MRDPPLNSWTLNLGVPSSASSPRLLSCLLSCSWHAGSPVVWGLVDEGGMSFSLMGRAAAPAPTVSRDPDSISSNRQHCHLPGVIKWYLNWIQKSHCKQPTWWGGRLWELELASKAAGSPEAAHVRPLAHMGTPGYRGGECVALSPQARGRARPQLPALQMLPGACARHHGPPQMAGGCPQDVSCLSPWHLLCPWHAEPCPSTAR